MIGGGALVRLVRALSAAGAVGLFVAALPGIALAHAELTASDPEADAVLTAAPDAVVLTFSAELDPDGSSFLVTDASGAEVGGGGVDLDVAERNVMRGEVAIDGASTFEVSWTSVAIDGHTETGSFSFVVEGDEAPDTALGSPSPSPSASLGVGIGLLLASVLAATLRPGRSKAR